MFLRVARWIVAFGLAGLAISANATTYNVSLTTDTVASDGQCSLREAIKAIDTQQAVNECAAGNGNDTVILVSGDTYTMPNGQFDIGGSNDSQGKPINASVKVEIAKPDSDPNAIIDMGGNSRAFQVHVGSNLTIDSVTVKNGDATAQSVTDGGLIYAEGQVVLGNNTILSTGSAVRGGLVYTSSVLSLQGAPSLESGNATGDGGGILLAPGSQLRISGGSLTGSTAGGDGGAIAMGVFPEKQLISSTLPLTLDASGTVASGTSDINSLYQTKQPFQAGDSIAITGTDQSGASFSSGFTYGAAYDGTTVNDLLTAVDSALSGQVTSQIVNGYMVVQANAASDTQISLSIATPPGNASGLIDFPSTTTKLYGSLNANNSSITVKDALIRGNTAAGTGGGMVLQGQYVSLSLQNVSVIQNTATTGAGAIAVGDVSNYQSTQINNVTVADNDSGTASVVYNAGSDKDTFINSVVVGDHSGADCGGALADANSSTVTVDFSIMGKSCDAPANGSTGADMSVLANENGACSATGGCTPASLDPYPAYLPAINAANTPFGAGNPVNQVTNSCLTQDQRGVSRLNDTCDAGSIEYNTAHRGDDEFTIVWGQPVTLDILAKNRGDSPVNCNNATTPLPTTGALCAEIIQPPTRPGASVQFVIDSSGYLKARYIPGSKFYGTDVFKYRINKEAFQKTRGDMNVEGSVTIVSQPAHGMLQSKTIRQLGGSVGGFGLTVGSLLLALRRRRRLVFAPLACLAVLLLYSGVANAADIHVTTLADNETNGDGYCSLREALISANDNRENLEPACTNGDKGNDTIILPRGCITLDTSRGPLQVDSSVTIKGVAPQGLDASNPPTGAECSPNDSSNSNWTQGTIIRAASSPNTAGIGIFDATGSLTLKDMSLLYGDSPQRGGAIISSESLTLDHVEFYKNHAADFGGAVYLVGIAGSGSFSRQVVRINHAYFLDNSSGTDGGGLSMAADDFDMDVQNSSFEGNTAAGTGGGVDVNLASGQVSFANVTVDNNSSGSGAGGIDFKNVDAQASMMNMTIVRNNHLGIDLGTMSTTGHVRMSNSIMADNGNDACSSDTTNPEPLASRFYNLFSSSITLGTECASDEDNANSNGDDVQDTDGNIDTWLWPSSASNKDPSDTTYVPPNLAIDLSGMPTGQDPAVYTKIVDHGNPANQANGVDAPSACRTTDVRGLTRNSGQERTSVTPNTGPCDIGAYELQQTTAVDDVITNSNSKYGYVYADVLSNDTTDPVAGQRIDTSSIQLGPPLVTPAHGGVVSVLRNDHSQQCTQGTSDDCVVLYNPEDPTPLSPNDGDEVPLSCADIAGSGLSDTFQYTMQAVDNSSNTETSNVGNVHVTIKDKAPSIAPVTVYNTPGGTKVITLDITDNFGGAVGGTTSNGDRIDYSTLKLVKDPVFAAKDKDGNILGTGIKLNYPSDGQITYVAGDTTKTFPDTFTVQVKDGCGKASNSAAITIRYHDTNVPGGDLIAGGASLTPLFALFGLGLFRRRRVSRSR